MMGCRIKKTTKSINSFRPNRRTFSHKCIPWELAKQRIIDMCKRIGIHPDESAVLEACMAIYNEQYTINIDGLMYVDLLVLFIAATNCLAHQYKDNIQLYEVDLILNNIDYTTYTAKVNYATNKKEKFYSIKRKLCNEASLFDPDRTPHLLQSAGFLKSEDLSTKPVKAFASPLVGSVGVHVVDVDLAEFTKQVETQRYTLSIPPGLGRNFGTDQLTDRALAHNEYLQKCYVQCKGGYDANCPKCFCYCG